jgi:hypothetical protein
VADLDAALARADLERRLRRLTSEGSCSRRTTRRRLNEVAGLDPVFLLSHDYVSAKLALCSTYSSLIRSGP